MEKISQVVVGMYQTNCYIIQSNGHACIIDPGKKADRIALALDEGDVVDAILLTHGHFDHIGAVDDLVKQYKCPVYIHQSDEVLLKNTTLNTANGFTATVSSPVFYIQEGTMNIGEFDFEFHFAPGHTEGSTLIQYKNHLFTGDVLFLEGIGRTDLYGGNMAKMRQSLQMIKAMNPELIVYPGHGDLTTIDHELQMNPYF